MFRPLLLTIPLLLIHAALAPRATASIDAACDQRPSPIEWRPCPDTAFSPDTPKESWRHIGSELVTLLGSPKHRGIDTIVNPGQDQLLIGKFVYGLFDQDLEDEKVEVWIEVRCRDWRLFGTTQTTRDGLFDTVGGIEDDGGRVFFTIPTEKRLPPGSYRVKMLVKGDHSEANLWLHVWERGTRVVVSDIDGTITTSENDGLWTVFAPNSPTPRVGAAATFRAYAAKGYRLLFVTARPEFATEGTRQWFADNGFPTDGVAFHLSPSDSGELGAGAQAYKTAYLQALTQAHGLDIAWAYGNKASDLAAYLAAGVRPEGIRLVVGEYTGDLEGATMIESYIPESERAACLPPLLAPSSRENASQP
ncbi:MAG: hypothetical protein LBM75_10965 [Myxococcales bacterium]|jgi:hypothetical protein|nr:hypothetical protein [Myxococcales bacterium]